MPRRQLDKEDDIYGSNRRRWVGTPPQHDPRRRWLSGQSAGSHLLPSLPPFLVVRLLPANLRAEPLGAPMPSHTIIYLSSNHLRAFAWDQSSEVRHPRSFNASRGAVEDAAYVAPSPIPLCHSVLGETTLAGATADSTNSPAFARSKERHLGNRCVGRWSGLLKDGKIRRSLPRSARGRAGDREYTWRDAGALMGRAGQGKPGRWQTGWVGSTFPPPSYPAHNEKKKINHRPLRPFPTQTPFNDRRPSNRYRPQLRLSGSVLTQTYPTPRQNLAIEAARNTAGLAKSTCCGNNRLCSWMRGRGIRGGLPSPTERYNDAERMPPS